MSVGNKHPHYHKDVRHLETIDVYRVLALFNVTDPCIQHAVKKLRSLGAVQVRTYPATSRKPLTACNAGRRCVSRTLHRTRNLTSNAPSEGTGTSHERRIS